MKHELIDYEISDLMRKASDEARNKNFNLAIEHWGK